MSITRNSFALNTIQWVTVTLGGDPDSPDEPGWDYVRPSFLPKQPGILAQVRKAGFSSVMLEVLPTQTLQSYARVLEESELRLAPGYVQVGLPESRGHLELSATARFRWFDKVRRRAEESLFMGLDRIFLAADMAPGRPRIDVASAVGYDFDAARLDRVANLIGEAAEILVAEGVKPALHNHVGTWIETADEFDHVLNAVPSALLAAGPDLGHLAWAGVDVIDWMSRNGARVSDVHVKDMDLAIAAEVRATPTPYFDVMAKRFILEPGLGDVPIAEALSKLPRDFQGTVIVEVDKATMEPFESAQQSWSWVAANYPEAA